MIEILVLQNPKVLVNKQEMMFPYKKVEALLYYMAVENQRQETRLQRFYGRTVMKARQEKTYVMRFIRFVKCSEKS